MSDENPKLKGTSNNTTANWNKNVNLGSHSRTLVPSSFNGGVEGTRPNSYAGSTAESNVVFSGADTIAFIMPKADASEPYIPLRNLGALSYSIHRDKVPVRSLGTPRAKSYTLGTRTIAGSIVMVNFDRAAFSELIYRRDYYHQDVQVNLYDEIPPFDMVLTFQNEQSGGMFDDGEDSFNPNLGKKYSAFTLKNIRLIDEGMVTGVDEAFLETTFQYVAEDIEYLKPITLPNKSNQAEESNGFPIHPKV